MLKQLDQNAEGLVVADVVASSHDLLINKPENNIITTDV